MTTFDLLFWFRELPLPLAVLMGVVWLAGCFAGVAFALRFVVGVVGAVLALGERIAMKARHER